MGKVRFTTVCFGTFVPCGTTIPQYSVPLHLTFASFSFHARKLNNYTLFSMCSITHLIEYASMVRAPPDAHYSTIHSNINDGSYAGKVSPAQARVVLQSNLVNNEGNLVAHNW